MEGVQIYRSKKIRLKAEDAKSYTFKKIDRIRLSEYPDISLNKKAVKIAEMDDGYAIAVEKWYIDDSPGNKYADHAFKVKLYLQQLDDEYHNREITTVRDV